MSEWRLFAPAEDWQHPLEIDEAQLGLLTEVGKRLKLRVTRDDKQKKFYLGLPQAGSAVKPGGQVVRYPSGLTLPKAVLSEAEAARYGTTGIYNAAPLVAAKVDEAVSDHFKLGEFAPHDASYKYIRVSPLLVERLEQIRKDLGGPVITIHSAYRPPEYNRSFGGVSNSAHMDGLAADISAAGISTDALYKACEWVIADTGGVGYYPVQQFCHIDVRGERARWTG